MNDRVKVVIIGFGNIGIDLMIKIMWNGRYLKMGVMVGVDLNLEGLVCVVCMDVVMMVEGIDGLLWLDVFKEIDIVFDVMLVGVYGCYNELL